MILELFNNYRNELIILAWLSAALLLVSIAVIPWIVIKIPERLLPRALPSSSQQK